MTSLGLLLVAGPKLRLALVQSMDDLVAQRKLRLHGEVLGNDGLHFFVETQAMEALKAFELLVVSLELVVFELELSRR